MKKAERYSFSTTRWVNTVLVKPDQFGEFVTHGDYHRLRHDHTIIENRLAEVDYTEVNHKRFVMDEYYKFNTRLKVDLKASRESNEVLCKQLYAAQTKIAFCEELNLRLRFENKALRELIEEIPE